MKKRAPRGINERFYDKSRIFAGTISALILIAIWTFFEASFWFIAPDFIIFLLAFVLPKKYRKFVLIAVIASVIGGAFYYSLNLAYPKQITEILVNTPFVSSRNIDFVSSLFENYGVTASLMQSITLIPFKIWTNLSVSYNFNVFAYFCLVIISRMFRFFIAGFIASYLGIRFREFGRKNSVILFIIYALLFIGAMILLEA